MSALQPMKNIVKLLFSDVYVVRTSLKLSVHPCDSHSQIV